MRGILLFLSFLLLGSIGVKGQSLFGEEQIISANTKSAFSVFAADLNGDGEIDIVSTSFADRKIAWYQNQGNGNFGTEKIIHNQGITPKYIYLCDLDGDGDTDILSPSQSYENIHWFVNDGNGNFEFRTPPNITTTILYVVGEDFTGDGNIDILTSDSNIDLHENLGDEKFVFKSRIFTGEIGSKYSIYACDLDHDGDIDILSASISQGKIIWFENDGIGNFSDQKIISTNTPLAMGVFTADLDNDGDIDILSASQSDDKIAWYQNDGLANFSSQKIISVEANRASSVYASDLDNDGDMDVLSSSLGDNKIAWYENDGSASFSSQRVISSNAAYAMRVYAIDLDKDGDIDVLSASQGDNKIAWYENLSQYNQINSFNFLDLNENQIFDNNEKPLSNQQLLLQPSANATFTNPEGYTYFFVSNGQYQLSAELSTLWELTTPETYNITINEDLELPTYYFGFKPTRILPKVEPHLSSTPTRCNRESTYWLNYTNTGTTIANGTITLEVDELMDFVSSNPEPDLIEGGKLTWNITDLHPSFENKIRLQFQMPDFNSIGEILETQATVQVFNENEELVSSKTTDYASEVLCSYDPNDKLVRSNLLGQSEFAYLADTILYTVRFQNTGNDTAFNIRIEDILDKRLDWTTFHPITASHDYRTELNRETGLATFYFDDIMLPDSTTNEQESHGFVMFGIASLGDLGDKTEVDNTASIFFDFNPPIITNTAILTLIEQVETDIETLNANYSIRVFPNPFSDFATIEVNGLLHGDYRLEIMDILGRKVRELKMEDGKVRLERGDLESGLYLFRILEGLPRNLGGENAEAIGGGKVILK